MAEDHEVLIARMKQLDSEVSEVTRDISTLKSMSARLPETSLP